MKFLAPTVLSLILAGCGMADGCENTLVREVSSAPGRAVLFSRECGATTGSTTQISLLKPGATIAGSGNVFVADGGSRLGAWGGPWADITWSPSGQLVVRYDANARVFQQTRAKNGTAIVYRPIR